MKFKKANMFLMHFKDNDKRIKTELFPFLK